MAPSWHANSACESAPCPLRLASFPSMRSGGRVVEGARLESEYTSKAYRGFESLPLRHQVSDFGQLFSGPIIKNGTEYDDFSLILTVFRTTFSLFVPFEKKFHANSVIYDKAYREFEDLPHLRGGVVCPRAALARPRASDPIGAWRRSIMSAPRLDIGHAGKQLALPGTRIILRGRCQTNVAVSEGC